MKINFSMRGFGFGVWKNTITTKSGELTVWCVALGPVTMFIGRGIE